MHACDWLFEPKKFTHMLVYSHFSLRNSQLNSNLLTQKNHPWNVIKLTSLYSNQGLQLIGRPRKVLSISNFTHWNFFHFPFFISWFSDIRLILWILRLPILFFELSKCGLRAEKGSFLKSFLKSWDWNNGIHQTEKMLI